MDLFSWVGCILLDDKVALLSFLRFGADHAFSEKTVTGVLFYFIIIVLYIKPQAERENEMIGYGCNEQMSLPPYGLVCLLGVLKRQDRIRRCVAGLG